MELKVNINGYYQTINVEKLSEKTLKLSFAYNKDLIEEVKNLESRKWNPNGKFWTCANSYRNRFVLKYLSNVNVYEQWEAPLVEAEFTRPLREFQKILVRQILTRKRMLVAAEMGTGKSLIALEVMERVGGRFWWIGPKSTLYSTKLELDKWSVSPPEMMITYDSLKKYIDVPIPDHIIFDEIHKLKNPSTQRSQAAKIITDEIRKNPNSYIIGLSGTPSPRSPTDIWHPCEILQPGFIRESNVNILRDRLYKIEKTESITGGMYPKIICVWDNVDRCSQCGKMKDDPCHNSVKWSSEELMKQIATNDFMLSNDLTSDDPNQYSFDSHEFKASINEVEKLSRRLKGLVEVIFKKDVLAELPDKIYKTIKLDPTPELLRSAQLIVDGARNTITAITLLRELADGFQYTEQQSGVETCPTCFGDKTIEHPTFIEECPNCGFSFLEIIEAGYTDGPIKICTNCDFKFNESEQIECPNCMDSNGKGTGKVDVIDRVAVYVNSPKLEYFKDFLDEYSEVGRCIVYAAFTGSVDKLVETALEQSWEVLRVDGRGWYASWGITDQVQMLREFQDKDSSIQKLIYIAQADSGGIGVTLTASPVILYYSNSNNGEARTQSEDRPHRIGMDINKGLTIIDLELLPTDVKILNNLKNKRNLELMTLSELKETFQIK